MPRGTRIRPPNEDGYGMNTQLHRLLIAWEAQNRTLIAALEAESRQRLPGPHDELLALRRESDRLRERVGRYVQHLERQVELAAP